MLATFGLGVCGLFFGSWDWDSCLWLQCFRVHCARCHLTHPFSRQILPFRLPPSHANQQTNPNHFGLCFVCWFAAGKQALLFYFVAARRLLVLCFGCDVFRHQTCVPLLYRRSIPLVAVDARRRASAGDAPSTAKAKRGGGGGRGKTAKGKGKKAKNAKRRRKSTGSAALSNSSDGGEGGDDGDDEEWA